MLGEGHKGVQFRLCPLGEGPMRKLLFAIFPEEFSLGEWKNILLVALNLVELSIEDDFFDVSWTRLLKSKGRKSSPIENIDEFFLNLVLYILSCSDSFYTGFYIRIPSKISTSLYCYLRVYIFAGFLVLLGILIGFYSYISDFCCFLILRMLLLIFLLLLLT